MDLEGHTRLRDQAGEAVAKALTGKDHRAEFGEINARVRDALGKFLYDKTRRRPMVLPVTIEV